MMHYAAGSPDYQAAERYLTEPDVH
jgi:hypothetical protein